MTSPLISVTSIDLKCMVANFLKFLCACWLSCTREKQRTGRGRISALVVAVAAAAVISSAATARRGPEVEPPGPFAVHGPCMRAVYAVPSAGDEVADRVDRGHGFSVRWRWVVASGSCGPTVALRVKAVRARHAVLRDRLVAAGGLVIVAPTGPPGFHPCLRNPPRRVLL